MQPTPAVRAQEVAHLPSAGWLRSTTIRVRLILAFSSLLALLLATAGLGAWQLLELNAVASANLRIERLMGQWHSEIEAGAVRTAVLARSDDASLKQVLAPQLEAAGPRIAQLQQDLQAMPARAGAAALFKDIEAKGKSYLDARRRVLERRNTGQGAEAVALLDGAFQPATLLTSRRSRRSRTSLPAKAATAPRRPRARPTPACRSWSPPAWSARSSSSWPAGWSPRRSCDRSASPPRWRARWRPAT